MSSKRHPLAFANIAPRPTCSLFTRTVLLASLLASAQLTTARSADYTWTAAATGNWVDNANYLAPGPVQGVGPTGTDTLTSTTSASTLRLRGDRAINTLTYLGTTTTWTIEANALSTLSAGNIVNNGSALLVFRGNTDAVTLGITTANVTVNSSITFGTSAAVNSLRNFSVSGTTTVTTGILSMNVDNSTAHTSGTYSLGVLNMSGGTVHLNQAAYAKSSTATVMGLTGTGGTIDNSTLTGALSSLLIINNQNNFTGGAAIVNGAVGTLAVEKTGTGVQALTGNSTYTGGTTITQGTLSLGAGGTGGSIVGNVSVVSSGTLAFNRSNAYAFGGTISGGGQVLQAGSGTTTLSAVNTYSGSTTVAAGTLMLTGSSSAGTGAINLTGGSLAVNDGVTAPLTNSGVVFKNASSTYVLTRSQGQSYSIYRAASDLDGDNQADTTASILQGTAGAGGGSFTTSFSTTPSSAASNDGLRVSDVFTLVGTGSALTDVYVLQLTLDSNVVVDLDNYIALLTGGQWVNAGTTFVGDQVYNSSFFTVGNYGVDTTTNSVWAVVDQDGQYSTLAIPEPSVSILLGLAACLVVWKAKKRKGVVS